RRPSRGQHTQRRRTYLRWQTSTGRRSRQQCHRHLRRGHRQVARAVSTDWYPTAVAEMGDQLLVLSGKGRGTHADPDGPVPLTNWPNKKPTAYTLGQLNGTLRILLASLPLPELARF